MAPSQLFDSRSCRLLVCGIAIAATAHAQSPTTAGEGPTAILDLAWKLRLAGDCPAAIPLLEQGLGRYPAAHTLRRALAICHEDSGNVVAALDQAVRYLPFAVDPREREELVARVARLRRRVGEVRLDSRVPGTAIEVDGVGQALPGEPLRLAAGPHFLRVARPGQGTREVGFFVPGGGSIAVAVDPVLPSPPAPAPAPSAARFWLGGGLGFGVAALIALGVGLAVALPEAGACHFPPCRNLDRQ